MFNLSTLGPNRGGGALTSFLDSEKHAADMQNNALNQAGKQQQNADAQFASFKEAVSYAAKHIQGGGTLENLDPNIAGRLQLPDQNGGMQGPSSAQEILQAAQSMAPTPEPYTLSLGSERRGSDNKVVASNRAPAKPEDLVRIINEDGSSTDVPRSVYDQMLARGERPRTEAAPDTETADQKNYDHYASLNEQQRQDYDRLHGKGDQTTNDLKNIRGAAAIIEDPDSTQEQRNAAKGLLASFASGGADQPAEVKTALFAQSVIGDENASEALKTWAASQLDPQPDPTSKMREFDHFISVALDESKPESVRKLAIAQLQSRGMNLQMTTNADGQPVVTFQQGGDSEFPIGAQSKAATSMANNAKVHYDIIRTTEEFERIGESALSYGGRLDQGIRLFKEKVRGKELQGQDKVLAVKFENFMSEATQLRADYLFGRGGKNLTKAEIDNLKGMLPNAGQSWLHWDFNSYTQYETRLKKLNDYVERAIVRDHIVTSFTGMADMSPEEIEEAFPFGSGRYNKVKAALFGSPEFVHGGMYSEVEELRAMGATPSELRQALVNEGVPTEMIEGMLNP